MLGSIIINWIDSKFGNILATENQQARVIGVIEVNIGVNLQKT